MTRTRRPRPTRQDRRTLRVEPLAERLNPVLGAYDIPAEVLPGGQYDAVVAVAAGSGSLLDTQRHILTVAHVGAQDAIGSPAQFFLPGKAVTIPALQRTAHGADDIAVIELAELGPLHLPGYGLYTGTDELGRTVTHVGYGHTGTGTSGLLLKKVEEGPDFVREFKRIRFQGTSTGGTYSLWLADSPNAKVVIAHNSNAAFIETAIELLPGVNDVTVKPVVNAPNHPYNGSFEVVFEDVTYENGDVPDLVGQDNVSGATVTVQNLSDGGAPRKKRLVNNVVSRAGDFDGFPRLRYDFDNGTDAANVYDDGKGFGAKEGMGAPSDSGSPVFIGNKIASLHKGPTGGGLDGIADSRDFGEASVSVRVSAYKEFIQDALKGQYALVLNMNNQIWGNNGAADNVTVRAVGDQVQVHINGVLRYQDHKAFITSVKVVGSGDADTITVGKIGANVPVRVEGGGGNDTININGVAAAASLWAQGDEGNDTFVLGYGTEKLASQVINANVQIYGDEGADTLRILDRNATDTLPDYVLNELTFSRPFIDPVVYSAEKVELFTQAGGTLGSKVQVNGSVANAVEITGGAGGDQVTVGNGNWDAIDNATIKVNGGGGKDFLTVDDAQAADGRTWELDGNTVRRAGGPTTLTYTGVEQLSVFAGDGADDFRVFSTPGSTQAHLAGNAGADVFRVGAGDLDLIGGKLQIDGGSGRDSAVINDEDDTGYGQYTVTQFGVSKAYFQAGLFLVDDVSLFVHQTGSTVKVDGTPAPITRVTGGAGNDQFLLSPTAHDLARLSGGLILEGGRGNDHVRLYDRNSQVAGAEFTVTGDSVVRDDFGDLSYAGMESLTLNLGNGANKVRLHGTSAGTAVTLRGNGGNDTFNVVDAPKSAVLVDGGTGFDVLQWNTGVAPSAEGSGFDFLTRVSVENTQFPIQF